MSKTYYVRKNNKVRAYCWNRTMESLRDLRDLTNAPEICINFDEDGTVQGCDVTVPGVGTYSLEPGDYLVKENDKFIKLSATNFKELYEVF